MSKRYLVPLVLSAVLLSACGGGGDDGGSRPVAAVDPASPNAVANAVLLKIGATAATTSTAALPTPSSDPAAPVASTESAAAKVDDTTGSATSVTLSFEANAVMQAVFAKIGGSSTLFTITPPPAGKAFAKTTQTFTVDLQLLNAFETGQFCVDFSGQDANGLVSNAETVCVVTAPPDVLQGTYTLPGEDGTLTFFTDGSYVLGIRHADTNCTETGVEVGTYDWNPTTHALTFGTPSINTHDDCALAQATGVTLAKTANGTLTLTTESGVLVLTPVASEPDSFIGSFEEGTNGTAHTTTTTPILTFFDDTHYQLTTLSLDATDPDVLIGIEVGCYSIDSSTDELTVDASPASQTCTTLSGQPPIDTNGDGGFSHPSGGIPPTITISGNTITLIGDSGPITATRIPAAQSPRAEGPAP